MVKIIWHYGEPPKNMQVRQVYAIVFDEFGRTLLKSEKVGDKLVYGMIVTPENAINLLGWGESAEKPIMRAFEIAQEKFNLKLTICEDKWM